MGRRFGATWRHKRRAGLQPVERASSRKSESRTPRAEAQMTRTEACQPNSPSIKKAMTTDTSGGTSRGKSARTTRRRNSQGKARERSVAARTMRRTSRPKDRQRSPRKRRSALKEGRRLGRGAGRRACRKAIETGSRGPARLCQEDAPPLGRRWEYPGTAGHSEQAEEKRRAPSVRKLRLGWMRLFSAGASLRAPSEGAAGKVGERIGRQHY